MNTPANVFSALLLFFAMMSKMAIAQEAANIGGRFLQYLKEESPEPEPFFGFMSMPDDGIAQGGGEPTPSTKMSDFLSKFKEEHVKLAEALSGKVDCDSVVSSAFAGKLSEGVFPQNGNLFQLFDEEFEKTCIYSTSKSGKSGKAEPSTSKIERFQVGSALEAGVVAPATIHDGKMYSPGIRNPFSELIFEQTLINLFILDFFLTCMGTKIEILLTIKFYIIEELEEPNSLFFIAFAFIIWWYLLEDQALPLHMVHVIAVPGVVPGFGTNGPVENMFAVMGQLQLCDTVTSTKQLGIMCLLCVVRGG